MIRYGASKALSVGDYAGQITTAWQSSIESILKTGHLLIDAKKKLKRGDFGKMVENDLPFGPNTAQRLMKVAGNRLLTNTAHAPLLPASWMTLYELSKLPDDEFKARIEDGSINPEMQRKDAKLMKPAKQPKTIEHDANETVGSSTDGAGAAADVPGDTTPDAIRTFAEFCRQSDPAEMAIGLELEAVPGIRDHVAVINNWRVRFTAALNERSIPKPEIPDPSVTASIENMPDIPEYLRRSQ